MNRFYDYLGHEMNVSGNKLLFTRPVFTIRRETFWGDFRWCGITYDTKRNCFYLVGGAFDRTGGGKIAKFTDIRNPLADLTIAVVNTGHSNGIAYDAVNDRILVSCGMASNDGAGENQYSTRLAFIDPATLTVTGYKDFGVAVQGVATAEEGVYIWTASNGVYTLRLYNYTLETRLSFRSFTKAALAQFLHVGNPEVLYSQNITYDATEKRLYWCVSMRDDHLPTYNNFVRGLMVDINTLSYTLQRVVCFDVNTTEEFQSAVFANDKLIAVDDVKYGIIREADLMMPSATWQDWIPANSDLNNYLSIGDYFSNDATNSATLTNTPITANGFTLQVTQLGSDNRRQVATSNVGEIYARIYTYATDTWSTWTQIN